MFSEPLEPYRRSPTAHLFEGGDAIDVSMFVTEHAHGQGPDLHTHPYPGAVPRRGRDRPVHRG